MGSDSKRESKEEVIEKLGELYFEAARKLARLVSRLKKKSS